MVELQTKETPQTSGIIEVESARIIAIEIPGLDDVEGAIPSEKLDLIVAKGKGKFQGQLMVEVGVFHPETGTSNCWIPRQWVFGNGLTDGKGVCLSVDVEERVVYAEDGDQGVWVPIDRLTEIL